MQQRSVLVLLFAALPFAAPSHAALLDGRQFAAGYFFPDDATPYAPSSATPAAFTVGAGLETTINVENVTDLLVDFTNTTLTVTFNTILTNPVWGTSSFNGPIFTAALPLPALSASVDPSSTLAGFDASRVLLSGNRIGLNWNGLAYQDGTVLRINFTPADVPVPATIALLGLGLAGLAIRAKRAHA